MSVNLYIAQRDEGIYQRAREAADNQGVSLARFIADALRRHLDAGGGDPALDDIRARLAGIEGAIEGLGKSL